MKTIGSYILFIFCFTQIAYPQAADGVVALDIPVRNSLMFNRFEVNPTFSFVREQNKYVTVTNKRELVQVEDAPQTYLLNYAGRFRENVGAGIGFFQQNYGVFTNFGGLINFAYNVRLEEESNLTFGLNVGVYKSGVNNGRVITNNEDPALNNIPSNLLLTINPGINYGSGFMDFGVSLNNAVTYNFESSGLLEENPKQGIQGHIMYTGYTGGYGFFSESRFSTLARTEFQKGTTIYSGVLMLTVPKGVWAQVGYNTLYGGSGGIGINITPQIAIEYNYEKPFSGFSNLGSAHELTLAYRFKNDNYYDYSRDDEVAGIFSFEKKPKKKAVAITAKTPEPAPVLEPETQDVDEEISEPITSEEIVKQEAEAAAEQERIASEERARQEAEEQARIASEEKARQEAEEQARIASEERARQEAEEQARIASEERARQEAEEQARIASEERAKQEAEEQARIASEEKARQEAEEQARIASEEQARQEAEEQSRIAAEAAAKALEEENSVEELVKNPTDAIGQSLSNLATETEASQTQQSQLLSQLEAAVASKESDLKDLKEENDLSEQDIYVEPKPFKSISKENEAIETLIIELDEVIIRQNKKILELESLLEERKQTITDVNDATNLYYENTLAELREELENARRSRATMVSSLERIAVATDFERKRRIKRAAYTDDNKRFEQDRAALKWLRETVAISETPLTQEDYDFGVPRNNNIQILKNIQNTDNGFYLVLAVHSNVTKRDEFLSNVIASGNRNVDFFYDVNTSNYYIFTKQFNSLQDANEAIRTKEDKAYNQKISIIKIEN